MIIQFKRKEGGVTERLTETEALERIFQLIWSDPRAYFMLELLCFNDSSIMMDRQIRDKLHGLGLTDEWDKPESATLSAFCTIGSYLPDKTVGLEVL